jgi:Fic family protein
MWMLLGEARSKCDHLAGVPLRPATAEEMHRIYLAKGAMATTAIEGNTLSENEVRQILDGKLQLPPSKAYLEKEVRNILNASNAIFATQAKPESKADLTPERIKEFNRQVLAGLDVEEGVVPGEIRAYDVTVGNVYRGAPPQDCAYLLGRLCEWLREQSFQPSTEYGIAMTILSAVLAHLYLAWIHPFGDGNGRTARLVELHLLAAAGVPMPAAHLLSNHYNETRADYYRKLHLSSAQRNVLSFLEYAAQGFVDGLKAQLLHIRNQSLDVTWENYVHERFKNVHKSGDKRRRDLVLMLSVVGTPVRRGKIPELSPSCAVAYREKSKTLSRDLRILREMSLIEVTKDGIRARTELIRAFLPRR